MGIFIEPPYGAQSIKAFEVLREAGVASARTGESISNQAVVLVDLPDLAKALAVFGKAEMRAVLDSDKFEISAYTAGTNNLRGRLSCCG